MTITQQASSHSALSPKCQACAWNPARPWVRQRLANAHQIGHTALDTPLATAGLAVGGLRSQDTVVPGTLNHLLEGLLNTLLDWDTALTIKDRGLFVTAAGITRLA